MANILIVEDEKNMQSIIAEYMQRGGHSCFTADDGVDALMILKNNPMDFVDGQEITLTHKEYELLHFFMVNPGQIFSREQLLNRIWGYDFEGTTRTVDTHIKTLRQKLGDEGKHIVTLIRSGYKFEVSV